MKENILLKIKESLSAVIPISLIIAILSFTITPLATDVIVEFIIGAMMLIVGTGFFTLGAEMSMSIIGERIGADLIKRKNVFFVIITLIILGTVVTIAEPDLKVLASQVSSIPADLIVTVVGLGVGIFFAISFFRIKFKLKLKYILCFLYTVTFLLALYIPAEFLGVAFDSGGATTGPMAVPFIIALGIGMSSIRDDKDSESDSFGIVAICSIGPIIAMLLLGLLYNVDSFEYTATTYTSYSNTVEIANVFITNIPEYVMEVGIALLPIIILFIVYQVFVLKIPKTELIKIFVGCIYEFIGLTLFLLGANVGFLPIASIIGKGLAMLNNNYLIIIIGMLMGYFAVSAEPAVAVLNNQVSDITDGAIPEKAMKRSLSIGVAIAIGLAMIRIITGMSVLWFLIPGYLLSIVLAFIGSDIFTAVAFDSGGVASGTIASTFLVPFAIGIANELEANIMKDAFGVIAMIAMAPIIAVQVSGLIYKIKSEKIQKKNEIGKQEEDIIELEWM